MDAGGEAYLFELAHNTPSVANINAYVDIVREKVRYNDNLFSVAGDIADSAYEPGERMISDLLDFAETRVFCYCRANWRLMADLKQ